MTKAKFGSLLLLCQGILVILFVVFVDYGDDFLPQKGKTAVSYTKTIKGFQDLHVSTFLGFGLIMTFLRRYSRGMLVHAFLIGTLVAQWATLLQGFFTMNKTKIEMHLLRMVNADYAVIAVLISLGAVMGKCNSLQLLVIALIETFFYAVNETINLQVLQVSDLGRSMIVHVFGAYFGLAVSRMIYSRKVCMSQALSMSYKSEMYTFIGTLFLWAYWPNVNASFVDGSSENRALANTFYALAASCTASFSFTVLQSKEGKFNVFHLQNATLAGGVAVGSIAAMFLHPWGAVIVGIVGALGSVLGYKYFVPKLRRVFKIHDTRGVQAAHGVPGILSGVASILVALLADEKTYGSESLYKLYPARAPIDNSTKFIQLKLIAPSIPPGEDRKAHEQALYQMACLGITILLAVVGGLITGLIIRLSFFDPVSVNDAFDDHPDFEESNCIDVSSDVEYDDDDDHVKHHDVVVGTKPRCHIPDSQHSLTNHTNNSRSSLVTSQHSLIPNQKSERNLVANHKAISQNHVPQIHIEMDVIKDANDEQQLLIDDSNERQSLNEGNVASRFPSEAAGSATPAMDVGNFVVEVGGGSNAEND